MAQLIKGGLVGPTTAQNTQTNLAQMGQSLGRLQDFGNELQNRRETEADAYRLSVVDPAIERWDGSPRLAAANQPEIFKKWADLQGMGKKAQEQFMASVALGNMTAADVDADAKSSVAMGFSDRLGEPQGLPGAMPSTIGDYRAGVGQIAPLPQSPYENIQLTDPLMLEQERQRRLAQAQAMNSVGQNMDFLGSIPTMAAGGSPEAQLANYEQVTGDRHFPAMIGEKEIVMNPTASQVFKPELEAMQKAAPNPYAGLAPDTMPVGQSGQDINQKAGLPTMADGSKSDTDVQSTVDPIKEEETRIGHIIKLQDMAQKTQDPQVVQMIMGNLGKLGWKPPAPQPQPQMPSQHPAMQGMMPVNAGGSMPVFAPGTEQSPRLTVEEWEALKAQRIAEIQQAQQLRASQEAQQRARIQAAEQARNSFQLQNPERSEGLARPVMANGFSGTPPQPYDWGEGLQGAGVALGALGQLGGAIGGGGEQQNPQMYGGQLYGPGAERIMGGQMPMMARGGRIPVLESGTQPIVRRRMANTTPVTADPRLDTEMNTEAQMDPYMRNANGELMLDAQGGPILRAGSTDTRGTLGAGGAVFGADGRLNLATPAVDPRAGMSQAERDAQDSAVVGGYLSEQGLDPMRAITTPGEGNMTGGRSNATQAFDDLGPGRSIMTEEDFQKLQPGAYARSFTKDGVKYVVYNSDHSPTPEEASVIVTDEDGKIPEYTDQTDEIPDPTDKRTKGRDSVRAGEASRWLSRNKPDALGRDESAMTEKFLNTFYPDGMDRLDLLDTPANAAESRRRDKALTESIRQFDEEMNLKERRQDYDELIDEMTAGLKMTDLQKLQYDNSHDIVTHLRDVQSDIAASMGKPISDPAVQEAYGKHLVENDLVNQLNQASMVIADITGNEMFTAWSEAASKDPKWYNTMLWGIGRVFDRETTKEQQVARYEARQAERGNVTAEPRTVLTQDLMGLNQTAVDDVTSAAERNRRP